jgi:hypothetical protein
MRTSSSQAEGAKREFAVLTQKFSGVDGKVQKLHCVQVDDKFKPIAGTEFELDAQLVLLAMGFVHPVHEGMLKNLGVDLDQRGNVRANTAGLQDLAAQRVLRRRHAPRAIAGGVGDPRGPAVRAGDRPVSDGDDDAAAVSGSPLWALPGTDGFLRVTLDRAFHGEAGCAGSAHLFRNVHGHLIALPAI